MNQNTRSHDMPMDADRKDKHDTLHRHELSLQNGKRDDHEYRTSVLVDICRALKTLIATDFVKPGDLEHYCKAQHSKSHIINWPTASIILGVIFILYQIAEKCI